MSVWVYECMSVPHACLVLVGARRGHTITQNWSYTVMKQSMWVLRTQFGSSVRATGALNCRVIPPVPKIHVENTHTIHRALPLHLFLFLFTLITQHNSVGSHILLWWHISGSHSRATRKVPSWHFEILSSYPHSMFRGQKTFGSFDLKSCGPSLIYT